MKKSTSVVGVSTGKDYHVTCSVPNISIIVPEDCIQFLLGFSQPSNISSMETIVVDKELFCDVLYVFF